MMHEPFSRRATVARLVRPGMARPWAALAVLLAGSAAFAQAPPAGEVVPAYAQAILTGTDAAVVPAGCATCGGGSLPAPYLTGPIPSGCGICACSDDSCGSCQCKPG